VTPGLGIPCSILLSYGRARAGLYGSAARRGKLARRGLLLALAAAPLAGPARGGERVSGAVVDGPDRLRLEDERLVRLVGLVVPGDLSPAPDGPERVAAARRRLEELVAAGPLELEALGEDRLGRVLARVRTADGRLVQHELVAAGLAWAFPDGLDRASARDLLAAEAEARRARRGLWAEPSLAVQDADRVAAEPPRFAVVEGTVARIGRSEAFTWLNFGAGRRRDFTVRIPATALPAFRRTGLPPDRLLGRRLRVRGWLFEAGGAMMEVEDALQIEVLE
jgi:micrococcal nuclease